MAAPPPDAAALEADLRTLVGDELQVRERKGGRERVVPAGGGGGAPLHTTRAR